jgi:hypothetical protein
MPSKVFQFFLSLKEALNQCDLKGRALFLFLASSGTRVGEALQITLDDLNLEADPPTVLVRQQYTKAGAQYYTFLTTEAKEALSKWLKVREAYIQSALNRGRGLSKTAPGRGVKNSVDDRIFPFSNTVAEENVVEAWAGHTGYIDDAYRRYTRQQLAELYKKAEPYLLINVPKGVAEIQSTFKSELENAKILDLTSIVVKLQNENEDLRRRIREADERLSRLEKLIQGALEGQSASDTKMS